METLCKHGDIMFTSSALYSLEDDWTDIVERHADLSEQLKYFIQSPHFTFTFIFTPGP